MNLRETLLSEHSKANTIRIGDYIGNDQQRFDALMKHFMANEYRITQRAAAVVNYCAGEHPRLIRPHLGPMIENLRNPNLHDAVKRNTVRTLQFIRIPQDLQGIAADVCFNFLASASETIAVRAFSMTVLLNIVKEEPGLKNELKLVVEELLPYGSTGLKNRARKTLAALEQL